MAAITSTSLTSGSCYATTSDPMVIWDLDSTSYSSNIPYPPVQPQPDDDEQKAKLEARTRNNARSLEGMRTLHADHSQEPCIPDTRSEVWAPRPTKRRTATATRNWRRA